RGTITSAMLRATDEDNSAGEITFTVKTLPADGTLLIDEVPIAVNGTFTQLDVDQNKISYQNNGTSHATDAFSFTVSDGHGGVISLVTFSIHIDITTAVETTPEVEFGIYPVPASEALNIKMVSDYRGAVNIRLIDLTGREMVNDDLVKSDAALNHSIDVRSISPGLLFLQITTTRYTRTLKLLKK
ncbi:MAG TPA: cadherin-like domain-containing protein, partial [Chryseosolibacter sp.]|nr:cadherin-like domain-containing protein [Chryseosolibacter sp.]